MKTSSALTTTMARFDRLSLRERVFVSAALLAAVLVLWNMLLMQPTTNKRKALVAELDSLQENLRTTTEAMATATALDPLNVAQAQLTSAQTELVAVNKELATVSAGLIPPQRMTEVIYDVLRHQQAVTLISLRNAPRQSLVAPATADDHQAEPKPDSGADSAGAATTDVVSSDPPAKLADTAPYVHPVELVIEGSYLDILAYTRALEALPWHFYWRRLDLQTIGYPRNRVRIELSTLSLDEAWLGV